MAFVADEPSFPSASSTSLFPEARRSPPTRAAAPLRLPDWSAAAGSGVAIGRAEGTRGREDSGGGGVRLGRAWAARRSDASLGVVVVVECVSLFCFFCFFLHKRGDHGSS